jgi:hypothetical protein
MDVSSSHAEDELGKKNSINGEGSLHSLKGKRKLGLVLKSYL